MSGGWAGVHELGRALGAQVGEMQSAGRRALTSECANQLYYGAKTQPVEAVALGLGVAMGLGLSGIHTYSKAKARKIETGKTI